MLEDNRPLKRSVVMVRVSQFGVLFSEYSSKETEEENINFAIVPKII